MPRRKHFTAKDRDRILKAADGRCHICALPIEPGQEWEVHHIVEWSLTCDDSDGNLAPAHARCHRIVTSERAPILAKVERLRLIHEGAKPKSLRPIKSRNTFRSRWHSLARTTELEDVE
jgi:5-methylcytosine-specific restriction enzyme A